MNYTLYPSLRGRTVFISGGSSGIGAELVRAFSAQGSRVAFCGTRPDGGDALLAELKATDDAAHLRYEACDVRDIAALQRCWIVSQTNGARSRCWSTTPDATTATHWTS